MAVDAAGKPRRRVNGEASRQKILTAATEIAVDRGYEGTSIALVSKRSGLPASSIYWHFQDKDALIAAVIDRSFESWLSSTAYGEPVTGDGSVEERLEAMMRRTGTALLDSSDFLRLGLMLSLERRAEEPTARRRFLTVRAEAVERTISTFGTLFPELDNQDLRRLSTFTMAVADGLFINHEIHQGTSEALTHDTGEALAHDTSEALTQDTSEALAMFDLLAAAVLGAARRLGAAHP